MSRDSHQPALEVLKDEQGSVALGWVGPDVFYARFERGLSAKVGMAHVARLEEILRRVPSLKYFSDSSALTEYDLLARSAFVRLVLENRRKFSALVMLTWSAGVTPAAQAFAAAVGSPVVILADAVEFDKLLLQAAPFARHRLSANAWVKASAQDIVRR